MILLRFFIRSLSHSIIFSSFMKAHLIFVYRIMGRRCAQKMRSQYARAHAYKWSSYPSIFVSCSIKSVQRSFGCIEQAKHRARRFMQKSRDDTLCHSSERHCIFASSMKSCFFTPRRDPNGFWLRALNMDADVVQHGKRYRFSSRS